MYSRGNVTEKIWFFLLFGMMCSMSAWVEAANIEWHTTNLRYELNEEGTPNDVLVIEGYFHNNLDENVNYFHKFNLTASITSNGYTGKVNATFRNFEKQIVPHGDAHYKFRSNNAEIIYLVDSYEVKTGYKKYNYSDSAG